MSVTLYTTRAQNQMRGYVENLNEVDKALTVFERKKVYVQS